MLTEQENKYLQLYQENINLQEALVRESKGQDKNQKVQKMPSLVSGSKKDQNKELVLKTEQYEQLLTKSKEQEQIIVQKEQENKHLQKKMEDLVEQAHRMELMFQDKIDELINTQNTLNLTCN